MGEEHLHGVTGWTPHRTGLRKRLLDKTGATDSRGTATQARCSRSQRRIKHLLDDGGRVPAKDRHGQEQVQIRAPHPRPQRLPHPLHLGKRQLPLPRPTPTPPRVSAPTLNPK
jgi:hypothetical protein